MKKENKNSSKDRSHLFQKGNKFGKGRPRKTKEEVELEKLTRVKFLSILSKYLEMTKDQLNEILSNKSTHSLDLMVVNVMLKAIRQGDEKRLNWILEQMFGKLKKKIHHSGGINTKIKLSSLSDEQLMVLASIYDQSGEVEQRQ